MCERYCECILSRQTECGPVTHSGMKTSSFIHGQESVAVDPFDANDSLRNSKEFQDTWAEKEQTWVTSG